MTRRSLFATLFAPLVAKFVSKRLPVSGVEIARNAERVRIIEFWPRENPVLYFMPPIKPYSWQDYGPHLIQPAKLDYALSQVNSMLDRWNSD